MRTNEVSYKVDIWLVIGTRRWARLLVTELCTMLPLDTAIHLQGNLDDMNLRDWWNKSPLKKRIQIVEQPLPCHALMTGVAFIVNSAYQHKSSIENVLAAGYNVVSEKPMTFSKQESLELLAKAEELGLRLFCTNTYLFADYLHVFKKNWLQGKQFTEINIKWSDPTNEVRYGEHKGYDSAVPVIIDLIPHVTNIILATHGEIKPDYSEVTVLRGGCEVIIKYQCGKMKICIQMARNSNRRTRLAKFSMLGEETTIDFSTEPGSVTNRRIDSVSADPDWQKKYKPIAGMLNAVREYFDNNTADERLSPLAGVMSCELIDRIIESYVDQQVTFLSTSDQLALSMLAGDIEYAVKESKSISERVMPYITTYSPLTRLACAYMAD